MHPEYQHSGEPDRENWSGKQSAAILFFTLLLLVLPAAVSADTYVGGLPLTTVKTGTVSGGVYMDANNTWWPASPGPQDVSKTFAPIPNVNNIAWARLYVAVYCGHMQNNYAGTVATTFDGNGDGTYETALGTENLNVNFRYIINGGNDNSALPGHGTAEPYRMVNDHTARVTSDYLTWYDVTSAITSPTPKAHVVTSAVSGSFDGRIKVITLVVAYNDGDSDKIHYWVNQGHDTVTYYDDSGYIGLTEFDLSSKSGAVESATLMVNHMASSDGYYWWIGNQLPRPADSYSQGAYFGWDTWDMTSIVSFGESNDLMYDRSGIGSGEFSGQFYKIPLAILAVQQSPLVVPVADFSATPVIGETPLAVQFTDLSTGPPSSWKWEYQYKPSGSSTWGTWTQFDTTKDPLYSFSGTGSYIIKLTATNSLGSNTRTRGNTTTPYITVNTAPPPVAAFSADPTSGTAPLAVTFTDQSTGSVTSWAWDFENDGTVDNTSRHPGHTFTTPGTFTVKLRVTGPGGTDDEIRTGYITVSEAPPSADFTATPRSGTPPLTVTFTDLSAGTITTRDMDFGDGSTHGSGLGPWTHVYTTPGIFNVSLTETGPGGSDTEVKNAFITVATTAGKPNADFTANRTVVSKNDPVKFTDKSTGLVTSWEWDFNNDGVTDSKEQDPVFAYASEGRYSVTLVVRGPGGVDDEKKIDYIKVRGYPDCDLTISGTISPVNLGSTVFAREPNTIRIISIKNNGPLASPPSKIELAASDGRKIRADIPALAKGANTTIMIVDPTVRTSAGAVIRYNATVDPDDEIAETDESNNWKVSADKTVTYNGYKGKRYWDGGDVSTSSSYDLKGGLVHSFGDSTYRSGSFGGSGWTSYTVTWSPSDLPIPSNVTVRSAVLYVPYTWDNSNAAEAISISFNGGSTARRSSYKDRSNFGAYADHDYGLQTYDVTSSFRKNGQNTATFRRSSSNAKLSMYGFTLAVVYEDPESTRKQIFLNEGFDLLGADKASYGTTPEEATAYVPFTGLTIDTGKVSGASLTSFVASGDGEGTLFFNNVPVGRGWDYGSVSGPQVAVLTRDVKSNLQKTGNVAGIQSTPGETPCMAAIQQFLIIEYGKVTENQTAENLTANFTAEPLKGPAPLHVNFTDQSVGNPISWVWDFENDGIPDSTEQNPKYSFGQAGNFSVNLTIRNATALHSFVRTGYITVTNATAIPLTNVSISTSVTTVLTLTGTTTEGVVTKAPPGDPGVGTPDPVDSSDLVDHLIGFFRYVADQFLAVLHTFVNNMPLIGNRGNGS